MIPAMLETAMLEIENMDKTPPSLTTKSKNTVVDPMFNKVGSISTMNKRSPSAVALDMIEQCRINARAEQSKSPGPYRPVQMMEDEDEVRLEGFLSRGSSGKRIQSSSQKHLSIPGAPDSREGHRAESSPRYLHADQSNRNRYDLKEDKKSTFAKEKGKPTIKIPRGVTESENFRLKI